VIFDASSFSHDHDHGCALRERRQRSRVERAVTWLVVVCHVASSALTIGRIYYWVRGELVVSAQVSLSERKAAPRQFVEFEGHSRHQLLTNAAIAARALIRLPAPPAASADPRRDRMSQRQRPPRLRGTIPGISQLSAQVYRERLRLLGYRVEGKVPVARHQTGADHPSASDIRGLLGSDRREGWICGQGRRHGEQGIESMPGWGAFLGGARPASDAMCQACMYLTLSPAMLRRLIRATSILSRNADAGCKF